ncbi:MAG: T9SS C-terminal target domain-containing protein [Bacteroidota bacterium]
MTKILPFLFISFLFFSCTSNKKEKTKPEILPVKTSLKHQGYISELPGKLNEISGLLRYDGLFWGFNDSGGKDKIYGFDTVGKIRKEIKIENANNHDWESIAQDKECIYIGDFGNNRGNRKNLKIYKIRKKDIGKDTEQKVDAEKINFSYSNQNNFSPANHATTFDCEALTEYNNNLYLFSKNWIKETTTVYKIPKDKGSYKVQPLDTFNVKGLVTGADVSEDKTKLALVGYRDYTPFIWIFHDISEESFFNGGKEYFQLNSLHDAQTEGICFYGNDTILVSCEKTSRFKQQVFLFDLTK